MKLKIAAFLFAAALAVVGILQYRWFSVNAASELNRVYRSIFSTVLRTAYREYERYSGLVRELNNLEGSYEAENLEEDLAALYRRYGPEGSTPFLVRGIGYISDNVYVPVAGNASVDDEIIENRLERQPKGNMDVVNLGNGQLALVFRLPARSILSILDTETFTTYYVQPAITGALPGYDLAWLRSGEAGDELHRGDLFPGEDYRFRLLQALFGRSYLERNPPVIPISPFMEWRGDPENHPAGGRPPILPGFRASSREGVVYVRVGLPEGQFSARVERNLALTWLGSIVLLAGIGTAFLLLLYQVHRVRSLREQERDFIASVSHELRTPLAVIQSAADNLSSGKIPAGRRSAYGPLILEQVGRLSAMIEEMLLFSGMEGDNGKINPPVPVAFDDFFTRIKTSLAEAVSDKGIALSWDVGGLPVSGQTDPDTLRLVLENLVMNAVYHAYSDGSGTVRICARLRQPATLYVTVEDDGRGIDTPARKRVFEPFYRDEVSRERQEKGSGLGLFIARRKARIHGGDLVLESPYEGIDGTTRSGCRFIFTLPCSPGAEPGTEEDSDA